MSADRELLELAAKAAGIELQWRGDGFPGHYGEWRGHPQWENWNPLTDDGDALRLLAKLKLKLYYGEMSVIVCKRMSHAYLGEDTTDDLMAATRRAIVRAAAEIGRAKP